MQCGTAPLVLHEADFEGFASVCMNLHPDKLYMFMYGMAGLSVLTLKCTRNTRKSRYC